MVLVDFLVGTGGWAYFPVTRGGRLRAYSRAFNFVEVNSTFYEYPDQRRVEGWRRVVPEKFTFSVRCHQDLTHKIGLKPVEEAYSVLNRMLVYCRVLDSGFLVLETPASYRFTDEVVGAAGDFLASVDLRGVRLVWENRAPLTASAQKMMQDHGVVQSADLSRQMPLFSSDVLYTRLFGKGKHNVYQFTDDELEEIAHKILLSKSGKAVVSFHGVRMNSDALRFENYEKTGKFPPVTGFTGADSARAVLAEDAKFPSSRQALIDDQGWKVFDASDEERIHLSEWLRQIPEKTYSSLDEVVDALEEIR